MQPLTTKAIKSLLLRLLGVILLLGLAWLWVMLSATPAIA